MIQTYIRKLVSYGVQTGLVPVEDVIYTTNRLLELFQLDDLIDEPVDEPEGSDADVTMEESELEDVLNGMMDST